MAIETMSQIIEVVQDNLNDDSFDPLKIVGYANKGLKEIAGLVLLPDLQTQDTVTTSASVNYVSMPSNYHRNLHFCYSETRYREVKIYKDFRRILRDVSVIDQAGFVFGVAVRGASTLHYQRLSAETLQLHFYEFPTELTATGDQPDCLPEHLVRPLLENYCLKEAWFIIEQDEEIDKRINTNAHTALFNNAMVSLINYLGPEDALPVPIEEGIDWDWMAYGE